MIDHQNVSLATGHHRAFGAWLLRLIAQVRQASEVFVAIQYAEPWKPVRRGPALRSGGSACGCPE
ncbi:MAG: hypothetical protein JO290_01875 [Sphingomonadaceae bacterium]|nr:hypothetical protein [Sphingomonadaceae bacterium]